MNATHSSFRNLTPSFYTLVFFIIGPIFWPQSRSLTNRSFMGYRDYSAHFCGAPPLTGTFNQINYAFRLPNCVRYVNLRIANFKNTYKTAYNMKGLLVQFFPPFYSS